MIARLIYILTLCMMYISTSTAGEMTLSWQYPTKSQSCSTVDIVPNVVKIRIFQQIGEVTDGSNQFVISGIAPGDYSLVATAVADNGQESTISNTTLKVVGPLVTQSTTVYTILKLANSFALLPVGDVPIGTECDEANSINGHYVVPIDLVTFYGNIKPNVVVADCL